jgi:hypothetical protein
VVDFKWPAISAVRNIGQFDLWRLEENIPNWKELWKEKNSKLSERISKLCEGL